MGNTLVSGLQWGDESKGKLVDILSEDHDVVVRSQGGGNAGHTVVIGSQTYKLHHVPSGILRDKLCIIAPGVVVHSGIIDEIDDLCEKGVKVSPENLVISDRTHLTFEYHKVLDGAMGGKIGTTKRGIGPTYADKMHRLGVRFHELLDSDLRELEIKLLERVKFANNLLGFYGVGEEDFVRLSKVLEELVGIREKLVPFVRRDVFEILLKWDGGLLFEGAQGTFLDIDAGTYPNCTSSNTTRGGAYTGAGCYFDFDKVIGVLKAYTTRVGNGPFPTEQINEAGERLRKRGGEVGTTTGRDRRCGWLDLYAARYSSRVNKVNEICLPKLDVLDSERTIPVCIGYLIDGKKVDYFPITQLEKAVPIYEESSGWVQDTTKTRKLADLPRNARVYIDKIQDFLGVPITSIGVGPRRDQMIRI